jgi:hypothetical protein
MNSKQEFAIEQLESRLEQFYCYYYWYVGVCYKHVLWFNIPYFCWKVKLVCY